MDSMGMWIERYIYALAIGSFIFGGIVVGAIVYLLKHFWKWG